MNDNCACVCMLMVYAKIRKPKKPRKDHKKGNLVEVDNLTNKTNKHRPGASNNKSRDHPSLDMFAPI